VQLVVLLPVFDLESVFVLRTVFRDPGVCGKRVDDDAHPAAMGVLESDPEGCVARIAVSKDATVGPCERVENELKKSRFAPFIDAVGAVVHQSRERTSGSAAHRIPCLFPDAPGVRQCTPGISPARARGSELSARRPIWSATG